MERITASLLSPWSQGDFDGAREVINSADVEELRKFLHDLMSAQEMSFKAGMTDMIMGMMGTSRMNAYQTAQQRLLRNE